MGYATASVGTLVPEHLEEQRIGNLAMRWKGRRASSNVDDRRQSGGRGLKLGGVGGLAGIAIILLVWYVTGDPQAALNLLQNVPQQAGGGGGAGPAPPPAQDEQAKFVSVVLADTEDVWKEQFRQMGNLYREPELVLFSGNVRSACGLSSAAV